MKSLEIRAAERLISKDLGICPHAKPFVEQPPCINPPMETLIYVLREGRVRFDMLPASFVEQLPEVSEKFNFNQWS